MRELDKKDWGPRKNAQKHDLLLCKYCEKYGGITFSNVRVDNDPYPTPREIDGVRFPSPQRKLITWSGGREKFDELLAQARRDRLPVQVIEVGPEAMNDRGTAGQVIVGSWLLEQYKVKTKKVLIYKSAIPRLKEFFKQHDVMVWTPKGND
jgi:hypothetical protein